jgi:putative ABC transport system permease protein
MMIIYERMREIGTVSAMGMSGGQIVRLFFMEAFFTSVIASGVGVLLGMALVTAIGKIDLTQTFEGLDFNFANIITLRLNLKSTLFTFVYSVAVASLISLIPSSRASRIDPVEALRSV